METRGGPQHAARRRMRQSRGYRRDVEGLRAVAVLAVVGFHAHLSWLPGGYVGVDVFFVISGYLITDLLWRELSERGRLSFGGFYGRRMRRLLPAAMLVLVVTMAAAAEWMPPLQVHSVWKDGIACALYVGNYRFALQETNYLTNSAPPSPFQHFWSLGVEEQFYLVWPVLLVAVSRLGREKASRARALIGLAVLAVVSLGLSLWLTHANEPWAFFSLPTRAWELAAGGLVALGAPVIQRVPRLAGAVLAWAGLAAIVVSVLAFTAQTPFPGTAALAPVLGAAALIAGGLTAGTAGPVLLLGRVVMRAIGRISYSWYLWHWPVLIIVPYAVGHSLNEWEYVGLALGSGVLAVLTYRFVETPARSSSWLSARSLRSLLSGATLSAAGVVACLLAVVALPPIIGHGRAPVAEIRTDRPGASAPSGSGAASHSKSAPKVVRHLDPMQRQFQADQAQVEAAVSASVARTAVPANLQPPLEYPGDGESPTFVDGCLLSYGDVTGPPCLFGDPQGTKSIVIFGDSHASMWFPAVDVWANENHVRLYVLTKAACPAVDISIFSPVLGRTFTECNQWRAQVIGLLGSIHPELVIVGIAPNYNKGYEVTQDGPAWLSGLTSTIAAIKQTGSQAMVMGPIPSPNEVVPDCVSAHLSDDSSCNIPRALQLVGGVGVEGIDGPGLKAEAKAVRAAGARFVNVAPWFCTATTCPAVVDNVLVYWDNSHMSQQYATYLAPLVDNQISQALGVTR